MHVCKCVYVTIYSCIYTRIYTHTGDCPTQRRHGGNARNVDVQKRTHTHTYTHRKETAQIYAEIEAALAVFMCSNTRTHAHTQIHTHTCVHTQRKEISQIYAEMDSELAVFVCVLQYMHTCLHAQETAQDYVEMESVLAGMLVEIHAYIHTHAHTGDSPGLRRDGVSARRDACP